MDNLTHSLAGIALAELALLARRDPEAAGRDRPWLWAASILGNNVPDHDVFWSHFLGGRLGYLLHHRGHTHTVVAGLLHGLVLVAGLAAWGRRRGAAVPMAAFGLALVGPQLHLWMDGWNLYGVHPWWPWDPSWRYGDRVFVVEPWLWVFLMPAAAATPPMAGWGRRLLLAAFAGGVAVALATGLVPLPLLLGLVAALSGWWRFLPGLGRAAMPVAVAASLVLVLGLGVVSERAKARVRGVLPDPVHDVLVSPGPADPTCWMVMAVEAGPGTDLYRVRRGLWSSLGSGVERCTGRLPTASTAPLSPVTLPGAPDLLWDREFTGSRAALRELARDDCRFRAMLEFVRIPYWHTRPDGSRVYGDLRFDRGPEIGFAEFEAGPNPGDCSDLVVPGWPPPVGPLLVEPGESPGSGG